MPIQQCSLTIQNEVWKRPLIHLPSVNKFGLYKLDDKSSRENIENKSFFTQQLEETLLFPGWLISIVLQLIAKGDSQPTMLMQPRHGSTFFICGCVTRLPRMQLMCGLVVTDPMLGQIVLSRNNLFDVVNVKTIEFHFHINSMGMFSDSPVVFIDLILILFRLTSSWVFFCTSGRPS